jgi:hypothetical protein
MVSARGLPLLVVAGYYPHVGPKGANACPHNPDHRVKIFSATGPDISAAGFVVWEA